MNDDAGSEGKGGALLWRPSPERIENSGIAAYRGWVNRQYHQDFDGYDALWRWSVADPEAFWESIWRYYDIAPGQAYARVLDSNRMPEARWFEGAELNFAQYLLRQGERGDLLRTAIFAESESVAPNTLSWRELREQVVRLASYLRDAGIEPGDRIVAYLPMSVEAVVALLACISVGAVWSSCSPDFGAQCGPVARQTLAPRAWSSVLSRLNRKFFLRCHAIATTARNLSVVANWLTF